MLDITRAAVALHGVQHAVNLVVRQQHVLDGGAGDRDLLVDPLLRVEAADAVVQQFIAASLLQARAPLMTTTGDFSAYAPAMELAMLSPPTLYVTTAAPRPLSLA